MYPELTADQQHRVISACAAYLRRQSRRAA
jgi:hypothetical protein